MINIRYIILILFFGSCVQQEPHTLSYPLVYTKNVKDTYHGISIEDPYRNIESIKDSSVVSWLHQQKKLSDSVNALINNSNIIYQSILDTEGSKSKTIDSYKIASDRSYLFLKRNRNEEISKLYYKKNSTSSEQLILDPSDYKKNQIIQYYIPSPDLSKIAIALNREGQNSAKIVIYDLIKRELLPEQINNVSPKLVGGINWLPDSSGFTYLKIPHFDYDSPTYLMDTASYVHYLGQDESSNKEIFSKLHNPELELLSADFPIVQTDINNPNIVFGKIGGNDDFKDIYYYKWENKIEKIQKIKWKTLFKKRHKIDQYKIVGDTIIYRTALNSSHFKICQTSLSKPDFENPKILVSEKVDRVIVDFELQDDVLYFTTLKNGIQANLYSLTNGVVNEITLPYPSGSSYINKKGNDLYVSINGWTRPSSLFRFVPNVNDFVNLEMDASSYSEFKDIVVEEIEVPSHDGAMVPLSIIYKDKMVRDGSNRLFINAYGAYGASNSPYFFIPNLTWVEQGGIYAVAHVRGGSEKGDSWHKDGYKITKPNSWKDFIACTEYLIENKYTSPKKTIAYGVSAGGITIGRAITERPDLFAVACLDVPFLNAVRVEAQPFGADSVKEFGSPKDSIEFKGLLAMDAYHAIEKNKEYPAIYVSTGMNDGLVPPWDPGKFVAKMQNMTASKKPILFSIDFDAGHGGDQSMHKFYKYIADHYSFALWQTGHPDFQPKREIIIERKSD